MLENGDYEDSERQQVIDEATFYCQSNTNEYREVVLPTVHLEIQNEQSTFKSLAHSLIAGFKRIAKDNDLVTNTNTLFNIFTITM